MLTAESPNQLYFGDCLDVMRENVPDDSVKLIYLDPPFNSKRIYNIYLGEKGESQKVAFDDTWRWHEAIDDFDELAGQPRYAPVMEGLRTMLGTGPELAYLSYMANRLVECRNKLAQDGTIYLHCDPTMSHYLKAVMDGIFGAKHFLNELIWYYRGGGLSGKAFARRHDVLLVYCKRKGKHHFNPDRIRQPYAQATVERFDSYIGNKRDGRDYGEQTLHPDGKHPDDVITHIQPVAPSAKARLYPTQKPLSLLEHILHASTLEQDWILDPFCGCGTAIHAAQNLSRRWIGIDICVHACKVIESRIQGHFDSIWSNVTFKGIPKTIDDARYMAQYDSFLFERWAASLVDGMEANRKQRRDRGIDGYGRIPLRKGKFVDVVAQVKGGSTGPGDVQAFNGARQQARADMGIFTCFKDKVTHDMRDAAADAGRFMRVPVIQLYPVEDYFEGHKPAMPVAA